MLKLYTRAQDRLAQLRDEEDGATATEYALIIGAASIVIVGALTLIGPELVTWVNETIVPILDGSEPITPPAPAA